MKNKIKKFLVKGNLSNQDNRKSAGITLIALVITIIILLILAGITIAQLSNSGLFNKAQEAKEKWDNAEKDENEIIAKYSNEIDSYVDGNRDTVAIPKEEYDILKNANSYSTTEKVIGTWENGKPIYRRFVSKTFNLSATTWTSLEAMSTFNIEHIVNCIMRRTTNGVYYPLCQDVNNNVSIYYPIQITDTTGYILEYTKTTD